MRLTLVSTAVLQRIFEWILVRVKTDAGITGLGEAHWGAGVREAVPELRELVLDEDPQRRGSAMAQDVRVITGAPWAGAVVRAANGIETTLFVGKHYRIPIYQLPAPIAGGRKHIQFVLG